jgi:hypothetical protein
VEDSRLLVEMLLFDEQEKELKAILWTKFTCINGRTGKKAALPEDFMVLAGQILVKEVDAGGGMIARVSTLLDRSGEGS